MKTANLAIVFTDIKGFTERTSRQTLEENKRLLEVHGELLRPLFRAFSGKVVKEIGDAFLVTFESPTQAVLCGVAIQDRLWEHNRSAPEPERIDVRVAVNVGEVRVQGGDVFGEPVNIAARVEAITEAGEVFFTEAVYLAMNKAEVPAKEVGEFELKGIPEKVRVFRVPQAYYRVEATGEPSEAQPPYGNLGLGKIAGAGWSGGELTDKVAEIGTRATAELSEGAKQLASQSATIARRASQTALKAVSEAKGKLDRAPKRIRLAALAGAALIAISGAVVWVGSPVDRAIRSVKNADKNDRSQEIRHARELIAQIKDEADREDAKGRLAEASGSSRDAVDHYQREAELGSRRAGVSHLLDLLESSDCRTRADAAGALGDLKATRAKGRLESLSESGGDGESDVPVFGCNSRDAAKDALRKLDE